MREDQFITHNQDFEWRKFGADIAQDGYSYGVQPDINHYEAAKCLTRLGADIYHPSQDDLTGCGNRLWRRFYPQSEAGKLSDPGMPGSGF